MVVANTLTERNEESSSGKENGERNEKENGERNEKESSSEKENGERNEKENGERSEKENEKESDFTTRPLLSFLEGRSFTLSGKTLFTDSEKVLELAIPRDLTILTASEIVIDSDLKVGGNVNIHPHSSLTITGSLVVGGNLTLEQSSRLTIKGSLSAGNIGTISSTVEVLGSMMANTVEIKNKGVITVTNIIKTGGLTVSGKLMAASAFIGSISAGWGSTIWTQGYLESNSIKANYASIKSFGNIRVKGDCELLDKTTLTSYDLLVTSTLTIGSKTRLTIEGSLGACDILFRPEGYVSVRGGVTVTFRLCMDRGSHLSVLSKVFVGTLLKLGHECILKVGKLSSEEKKGSSEEKKGSREEKKEEFKDMLIGVRTNRLEEEFKDIGDVAVIGSIVSSNSYIFFRGGLIVSGSVDVNSWLFIRDDFFALSGVSMYQSLVKVNGNFSTPILRLRPGSQLLVKGNIDLATIAPETINAIYDKVRPTVRLWKPPVRNPRLLMSSESTIKANDILVNGVTEMADRTLIQANSMVTKGPLVVPEHSVRPIGDGILIPGTSMSPPKAKVVLTENLTIDWDKPDENRTLELGGAIVSLGSLVTSGLTRHQGEKISHYGDNQTITWNWLE